MSVVDTTARTPALTAGEAPGPGVHRSRTSGRIPSLDGLRAIAISFVILGHLALSGQTWAVFNRYSNFGVQVFFVISGYLITTLLIGEYEKTGGINLRRFYARRALRIFPAAYAFVVVLLIVDARHMRLVDAIAALTYSINFDATRPWSIGHLWSLAVEEQFYLLWPVILGAFYAARIRILVGALVAAPLISCVFYALHWNALVPTSFPTVADGLAAGCLAAILAPRLRWTESRWTLAAIVPVLLIPLYRTTGTLPALINTVVFLPLLHVLLAVLLLHVVRRPYGILNTRLAGWVGIGSYSLYLWQQPFLGEAPVFRFGFVGAAIAAAASYFVVERPLLRWRDRNSAPPTTSR